MEYECGISTIELQSYDNKVGIKFVISSIFLCKIFEYQLRVARMKNKWMALTAPYFVCNNLMKALYNLSPNDDSEWNMTLQPDSYSSPDFVVSLTFANHSFDT